MGKRRRLIKYKEGSGKIQKEAKCKSKEIRKVRYSKRKRL